MIAVYVSPESMTIEQANKVHESLDATGAPEKRRKHHSYLGEDGHLVVFDFWETQQDFDVFAQHLGPILQEVGISGHPPVIALEQ